MDTYRYFAALYASRAVSEYLKECRHIVSKMTGNSYFPAPNPSLTLVTTHLDTLEDTELAAHHGPKGSIATRNVALLVVRGDMRMLKSGVQLAADADITHAQVIIESSGMYVTTRTRKGKAQLAARYGGAPGLVILDAKAIDGQGSYQWQMCSDGKTWLDLPPGVEASTLVTGLTPVMLYSFRFRTLTKVGLSDWSTPVTFITR
jgi:hypothetical protein